MTLAGARRRVARAVRSRTRELRRRRFERRLAAPRLLRAFADAVPAATFVEIGANDGEQHDHLRPFILSRQWRGVMVEPVPYIFERLSRNYADVDRVALENAAIGAQDGSMPFYYLVNAPDDERRGLPDWYDGIGSFSKEFVLSHARHMPDIEERLVCADVPVLSFDGLCRKHGFDHVDLVVVDTEGYDWELVRTIDFQTWRPQLLIYEHYHLVPEDRVAANAHMREQGFQTMEEGFDTFCLGAGADARLRDLWSGLRPHIAGQSVHDEL